MGATAPKARLDLMLNSLRQPSQGLHHQLPHHLPHQLPYPTSPHQQAQHQNLSQNHEQQHEQAQHQQLQQQPRQQGTYLYQVTQHRPLTQTLGRHNLSHGDIDPFVTSFQFRNQMGASEVGSAPGEGGGFIQAGQSGMGLGLVAGGVGGLLGKGLGYSPGTVSQLCSAGLPGAGGDMTALAGASSWESITSGPTWGTQQLHQSCEGVSHGALGSDQVQGLQAQGLEALRQGQTQARYLLEVEHCDKHPRHGAGADSRLWQLKQHITHKQHMSQHIPYISTNFTAIGGQAGGGGGGGGAAAAAERWNVNAPVQVRAFANRHVSSSSYDMCPPPHMKCQCSSAG
jgi:hypothetical protein